MSMFFRGVSAEQDGRYSKNKDGDMINKMTKEGKFASVLESKVDFTKVNIAVITKWVDNRITEILGFQDEIVISLVTNILNSKTVDPKRLQIDITGFLEKQSKGFIEELWTLLVDAQTQPSGIPSVFIQKKKEEILQRASNGNFLDEIEINSFMEEANLVTVVDESKQIKVDSLNIPPSENSNDNDNSEKVLAHSNHRSTSKSKETYRRPRRDVSSDGSRSRDRGRRDRDRRDTDRRDSRSRGRRDRDSRDRGRRDRDSRVTDRRDRDSRDRVRRDSRDRKTNRSSRHNDDSRQTHKSERELKIPRNSEISDHNRKRSIENDRDLDESRKNRRSPSESSEHKHHLKNKSAKSKDDTINHIEDAEE